MGQIALPYGRQQDYSPPSLKAGETMPSGTTTAGMTPGQESCNPSGRRRPQVTGHSPAGKLTAQHDQVKNRSPASASPTGSPVRTAGGDQARRLRLPPTEAATPVSP